MEKLLLIEEKIGNLRRSEVKVARCVLSSPDAAIHYSICELAGKAGVSEPTVLRFCRGLGFKGYQDFKISLAQALIPQVSDIYGPPADTGNVPKFVKQVFDENIQAINNIRSALDFSVFEKTVELLDSSPKTVFHGVGGSAPVAMYAWYSFFRIGVPVLWFEDTHTAVTAVSAMKEREVFFAVSRSGASRDIVEALHAAAESGAETVAIVDYVRSPVAEAAKYVLCAGPVKSSLELPPVSSRTAQMSIIDALVAGVSHLHRAEIQEHLKKARRVIMEKKY